jgi:hypothetical protein
MRRTVLMHTCGAERERAGAPCTCRQKVTRRAALGLVDRGQAVWWKRLGDERGHVVIHYAIAIVAPEWRPARTVTHHDIERAAGGDDSGERERKRIEQFHDSTIDALVELGAEAKGEVPHGQRGIS